MKLSADFDKTALRLAIAILRQRKHRIAADMVARCLAEIGKK